MYGNEFYGMLDEFSRLPSRAQHEFGIALGAITVIMLIVIFVILLFAIVYLVGLIIGRWMLFTKAGQAGWKSIIPFYGEYVYVVDVCKCHWVLFLLELLLFWNAPVMIFINAMINYNLAIKTHQSPTAFIWFTVFGVPVESIMGLCRKSYEYNENELSSKFGFIGTKQ